MVNLKVLTACGCVRIQPLRYRAAQSSTVESEAAKERWNLIRSRYVRKEHPEGYPQIPQHPIRQPTATLKQFDLDMGVIAMAIQRKVELVVSLDPIRPDALAQLLQAQKHSKVLSTGRFQSWQNGNERFQH